MNRNFSKKRKSREQETEESRGNPWFFWGLILVISLVTGLSSYLQPKWFPSSDKENSAVSVLTEEKHPEPGISQNKVADLHQPIKPKFEFYNVLPDGSEQTKVESVTAEKPELASPAQAPKEEVAPIHAEQVEQSSVASEQTEPPVASASAKVESRAQAPVATKQAPKSVSSEKPIKVSPPSAAPKADVEIKQAVSTHIESTKSEKSNVAADYRNRRFTTMESAEAMASAPARRGVASADAMEQYFLQLAAFQSLAVAQTLQAKLVSKGYHVKLETINRQGSPWHKVIVGPFSSKSVALQEKQKLSSEQHLNSIIMLIA